MSKLCLHYTINLFKLQFSYDYFLNKTLQNIVYVTHYTIL